MKYIRLVTQTLRQPGLLSVSEPPAETELRYYSSLRTQGIVQYFGSAATPFKQ